MADKIHKLKLKMGDIEIELEGDKKFVKEYFNEVKGLISATGGVSIPKLEAPATITEPAEAPKKRKRGRPRKTEVEKVEEEVPKKRKRGRPRKTEAPKVEEETPTKRKRGRPRKTEVAKVEEEVPKKRKRGRPRKTEAKPSEVEEEKPKVDLKSLTLPEMIEVKKPTKEEDRILIMAFYLNKVKRKREFRAKDIEELYKTLNIDPPSNISYYLRKLSSEKMGLLVPGKKKGRYKISNLGIIYLS